MRVKGKELEVMSAEEAAAYEAQDQINDALRAADPTIKINRDILQKTLDDEVEEIIKQ